MNGLFFFLQSEKNLFYFAGFFLTNCLLQKSKGQMANAMPKHKALALIPAKGIR